MGTINLDKNENNNGQQQQQGVYVSDNQQQTQQGYYNNNENPYNNNENGYVNNQNPYNNNNVNQYNNVSDANSYSMLLTLSIILTVISTCCCNIITLVLGIVAIVYTVKGNDSFRSGDITNSESYFKVSRILCIVGASIIIIGTIISFAYVIISLALAN